jgi:hypothetical protein
MLLAIAAQLDISIKQSRVTNVLTASQANTLYRSMHR